VNAIRIRKKIDSETLYLPELKPLVGTIVEIVVVELTPATRDEFYGEAAHVPEAPEERAAQQELFRRWRADPRFECYWPILDRLLRTPWDGSRQQGQPAAESQ
jgi:hypothetical protein